MKETIDRTVFAVLSDTVGADFIGELIDTFIEESPGMFQEMQQALSAGDVDTFRRAAHSLKTNANTFGATDLAEQARDLEYMARENNLDVGDKLNVLEESYKKAARELTTLKEDS